MPQDEQFEGGSLEKADKSLYIIVSPYSFAYNPARINVGSIGYQNEGKDVIISSLYEVFKTVDICNDSYLWHYLNTKKFNNYVGKYAEGGVRQYLFYDNFCRIPIHLPSIDEQNKVSEFLNLIDKKIQAQQQLVELLKKYKRGMIESTLNKEVTTSYNLSDVAKIYDGTHQTPIYMRSGIKFVSVENINNLEKTEKYISHQSFIKEFKIKPEKGDVLMTRIGDIGTAAYIDFDDPVAFYVSLALFKCKNLVSGKFLSYYICSNQFQKELWKRTLHIAFPKKINTGEIGDCKINLPNLDKQIEISSILDKISKKISFEETKLNRIIDIKKGLLQQLFI